MCLSSVAMRAAGRDERVPRSSMGQGAKSKHIEPAETIWEAGLLIIFMRLCGKAPFGPDWILRHYA